MLNLNSDIASLELTSKQLNCISSLGEGTLGNQKTLFSESDQMLALQGKSSFDILSGGKGDNISNCVTPQDSLVAAKGNENLISNGVMTEGEGVKQFWIKNWDTLDKKSTASSGTPENITPNGFTWKSAADFSSLEAQKPTNPTPTNNIGNINLPGGINLPNIQQLLGNFISDFLKNTSLQDLLAYFSGQSSSAQSESVSISSYKNTGDAIASSMVEQSTVEPNSLLK